MNDNKIWKESIKSEQPRRTGLGGVENSQQPNTPISTTSETKPERPKKGD